MQVERLRWLMLVLIGSDIFVMHEGVNAGTSADSIPFPWTALNVSENGEASVARRRLRFGNGPLPSSIRADGQEVLGRPASVSVASNQSCAWSLASYQRSSSDDTAARWVSHCVEPDGTTIAAHANTTLHVDGWITCDLFLTAHVAENKHAAVNVTLVLSRDATLYNHAMVGWRSEWNGRFINRQRPEREWWSGEVPYTGLNLSFTPQLWVGNDNGQGVAFLSDGPTNWSLPAGMHERTSMFVSRSADVTMLTVSLVEPTHKDNRTYPSGTGRTLRFGLMPTPVRPIDDSRQDLHNPKISPAMGWIQRDGVFNENLVMPGALADPSRLSALSGDVSIALWVRVDQPQESMYIAGNSYVGLGMDLISQKISVALLDMLGESHLFSARAPTVTSGRWMHLVVAFAQQKHLAIYVDGQPVHTEPVGFTFQSGTSQFTLCGAALDNPVSQLVGHRSWYGGVADLQITSHALNDSEVHNLHASGVTSRSAMRAMVAKWSFSLDDQSRNNSYAASLWPCLPLQASTTPSLALVLNSQASPKVPASFAPGVVVAGPQVSSSSQWALQLEGRLVQISGNVRNATLLEYTKNDLQFDFVVIWEDWSDIWGFPGISAEKYKSVLRRLVKEAHRVKLKVLPYIDISQLSERAPDFAEIFEAVKVDEDGKQHPANASNQLVYEVDSSSPAWGKYWNDHLRSFVAEFPELDGFYCDVAGLKAGMNDAHGRANYNIDGSRMVFAEMYNIVHAAGMVLIQDNSVPATVTHNFRADILLTGEIHYELLQYHNRTAVGGLALLERIPPTMAQSWWNFARVNVPTVFDTKPPGEIIHNNGAGHAICPSFSCGWDRQKIVTTRELEMITGLHGMSLWGPVGSNSAGTSWYWWQALQAVGCHHSSSGQTPADAPDCQFHGYWQTPRAQRQEVFVSYFDIHRNVSLSPGATPSADARTKTELLLLVANYGEHHLLHTTATVPVTSTFRNMSSGGWTVKHTWPEDCVASVDEATGELLIGYIGQHELLFVHLV